MSSTLPKQSHVGGIDRDDSVTPLSPRVLAAGGRDRVKDRYVFAGSKYSRVGGKVNPLQCACWIGDPERVLSTASAQPHLINQEDDGGITPLMLAASRGNTGIVVYLTSQGSKIHTKALHKQTALHFACIGGHCATVEALLNVAGANVDECDESGLTPLMLAASKGHTGVLKILLHAHANVLNQDINGRTAFHHACISGHLEVVRLLMSKMSSAVNQGDNAQLTPLMLAVSQGHQEVVEIMLSSNSMPKTQLLQLLCKKSNKQQTALHLASLEGHLAIVVALFNAGANIDERNDLGLTPLMLAISKGHNLVVKWLLNAGANIHEKDSNGRTALHIAAGQGAKGIIASLVASGAEINHRDGNHHTPLITAAIEKQYGAALQLIKARADVCQLTKPSPPVSKNRDLSREVIVFAIQAGYLTKAVNCQFLCALYQHNSVTLHNWDTYKQAVATLVLRQIRATTGIPAVMTSLSVFILSTDPPMTELMWSSHNGYDSLVKHLILQGVDVNVQNPGGDTALHFAALGNHIQCGLLLAKAGANVRMHNKLSQTPFHVSSTEFRNGILELLSFQTRKICCVLGNALNGKSTLIKSLKNENASVFTKVRNWVFGVSNVSKRTAGIEPVSLASKYYGNVLFYDFAGQSEYHGPHELFLESIISRGLSSVAVIVVVNITEKQSVMFQQVNRWLQPFYKLPSTTNPIPVILVGSHLDIAKKSNEAKQNIVACCEELKNQGDSVLQFGSICCLDCRQPYAPDIPKLCKCLRDVPLPQCEDSHTGYSLPWVISQIRSSFMEKLEVVPLSHFAAWIDQNKANLPTNLPPAEEVCRDLASTGHFLYLPSTGTLSGGWLVLDLPSILKDIYGNLFTSGKSKVSKFGLLSCEQLPELFPRFVPALVLSILMSLGFSIAVDPSFLSDATLLTKNTDCRYEHKVIFIPALVTASQPDIFSTVNKGTIICCWQFNVHKKFFLSPLILQAVILRLVARHVFTHKEDSEVRPLAYRVWLNGIFWKSCRDVDVAVQINDNTTIRVIGCCEVSGEALCNYMATVVQDIASIIKSIDASIHGSVYIMCLPSGNSQLMLGKSKPFACQVFPIEAILQSIESGSETTISLDSPNSTCERKAISELFGGFKPSLEAVQAFFVLQDSQTTVQSSTDPSSGPTVPTESHSNHVLPTTEPQAVSPGTSCNLDCHHGTALTTPTGPTLTTPTSSVLPSPNMETLDSLIVHEVAARWKQVGVHLGMTASALDNIQANYPCNVVQCCHDMFSEWLLSKKGTGTKPRTWETVLSTLEKANFSEVAVDLRKNLDPQTVEDPDCAYISM